MNLKKPLAEYAKNKWLWIIVLSLVALFGGGAEAVEALVLQILGG